MSADFSEEQQEVLDQAQREAQAVAEAERSMLISYPFGGGAEMVVGFIAESVLVQLVPAGAPDKTVLATISPEVALIISRVIASYAERQIAARSLPGSTIN